MTVRVGQVYASTDRRDQPRVDGFPGWNQRRRVEATDERYAYLSRPGLRAKPTRVLLKSNGSGIRGYRLVEDASEADA